MMMSYRPIVDVTGAFFGLCQRFEPTSRHEKRPCPLSGTAFVIHGSPSLTVCAPARGGRTGGPFPNRPSRPGWPQWRLRGRVPRADGRNRPRAQDEINAPTHRFTLRFGRNHPTFAKALLRSSIRSLAASMPIEKRIIESVIPLFSRSSGVSPW